MARTRGLMLVPILVFLLLLLAVVVVNLLRPQPAAAPGLHKTSTSIWQLPEIHPEGVSPAPVPPGQGAPGKAPGGGTTAPVVQPPYLLPAKGADRQPPGAPPDGP